MRAHDGAFRWFKTRSVPIRDARGAIVRWYATSTDVDDLKQAAGMFASVLDGISDAVVALDDALCVSTINSAAERLLGVRRSDVLGESFFSVFPGAAGAALEEKCEQAIRERRALTVRAELDQRSYAVRVYPHAGGISVFLQPAGEALS